MFDRISNVFENKETKERREKVFENIKVLGDKLINIQGKEGVETIVEFFNAVSTVQDSLDINTRNEIGSYLEKKKKEAKEKFDDLCSHISQSGREEFGWNRTKKGENVTEDKVYLGNVYGLFTKTVQYWKSQKNEAKGGWGYSGMEDFNSYDVVNKQAAEFMKSHDDKMIEDINFINVARKG